MITLAGFLGNYGITKERFMQLIEPERSFFDDYINWGDSDEDTTLHSKAAARVEVLMKDEKDGVQASFMPEPTEQMTVASGAPSVEEPKKRKRRTAELGAAPAKRRSSKAKQYAVTKTYLSEHGKPEGKSIRDLRKFLMCDGVHGVEDVALMSDEDVISVFSKEYYVIEADSETYIIRRSALAGIVADMFIVGRD